MRSFLLGVSAFVLMTVGVQAAQINLAVTLDGDIDVKANGASDIGVITDGYFPEEAAWDGGDSDPEPDRWNGVNNVAFSGNLATNRDIFYFDFGSTYVLNDVRLAVDNNDQYDVEYFTGTGWNPLFTILSSYGSASPSMDNFSTILGDDIRNDGRIDYDSRIDFLAVETSMLRLYAYNTTWDTNYSIGEFQAFGTLVEGSGPEPVPEPSTILLLGSGLAGLAWYGRKRRKE
ncbi:PEP-CTERM protein-sorting domain-containing protein [Malonomonas rubra DSM 5091]|uniref:PEP-CTERM protein-sorting domain-containing protein n=1 Tax=Malonomonas rubra DSM 5091 TaxID=1122189 RepID=A0A1M6E0G4_MALRU|nr:PEP-CTERM sorting domain-containing protein [Malonomonas rubra]SHI78860.1 PEP-CTERM protein-sorting domain-containing protein [Malonomonas rubra DSM 5091]